MKKEVAGGRWQVAKGLFVTCHLSLVTILLSACGFEPLYSQHYRSTLTVDLSSILVDVGGSGSDSGGRYGELLKAEIEDQVNPRKDRALKQFRLVISYKQEENALFVNPDGTSSRGDLIFISSYTLTRLKDSKQIASGTLRRISSYNTAPQADYATYVSMEDARKRGIIELAQDYKLRLAALLPTLNDPVATALEVKPTTPNAELHPIGNNDETRSTRY